MHSEPLRAFRAVARNARRPGGVAGPASREGAWTVTLYSRAPAKIHRTRHGYVNKLIFVVNDACGVAKGPLGVFEAISGIAPRACLAAPAERARWRSGARPTSSESGRWAGNVRQRRSELSALPAGDSGPWRRRAVPNCMELVVVRGP